MGLARVRAQFAGEYEALDQQSLALTEVGESRASRLALRQALEGCISYSPLLQIPEIDFLVPTASYVETSGFLRLFHSLSIEYAKAANAL